MVLIPDTCHLTPDPSVVRQRACSSARLERTPDKREVGSSSLPRPTNQRSDDRYWVSNRKTYIRGCSSIGRAPALQAGGRRFDSVQLHQLSDQLILFADGHLFQVSGITSRTQFLDCRRQIVIPELWQQSLSSLTL